jgi:hypothetical protein
MSPDDEPSVRRPISVYSLNALKDFDAKQDYLHDNYYQIRCELQEDLEKLDASEERLNGELPDRHIKENDEERVSLVAELSNVKEEKAEIKDHLRLMEKSWDELAEKTRESVFYAEQVLMPSFVWHLSRLGQKEGFSLSNYRRPVNVREEEISEVAFAEDVADELDAAEEGLEAVLVMLVGTQLVRLEVTLPSLLDNIIHQKKKANAQIAGE